MAFEPVNGSGPGITRVTAGDVAVPGAVKKMPLQVAVETPVCKIATFHPRSLAPFLATLPALVALRESFPGATIFSWARDPVLPLLENFGAVDKAGARPAGGIPAQAALMARLRTGDFDIAVSFSQSSNALLLAWSTGAPIRAGFVPSRMEAFLTHRVEKDEELKDIDAIELVRSIGASPRGQRAADLLHVPFSAEEKVSNWLDAVGIRAPYLVVAPNAIARNVGAADREASLAEWKRAVLEMARHRPVVVAAPRAFGIDLSVGTDLHPTLNLSGKLDVLTLVALCRQAEGVIGEDSGALALADFLGRRRITAKAAEAAPAALNAFGL